MAVYAVIGTYAKLFFEGLISFKLKPYSRWPLTVSIRQLCKSYSFIAFYHAHRLVVYEHFGSCKSIYIYIPFKFREFIQFVLLIAVYVYRIALGSISITGEGYSMASLDFIKRAGNFSNFLSVHIQISSNRRIHIYAISFYQGSVRFFGTCSAGRSCRILFQCFKGVLFIFFLRINTNSIVLGEIPVFFQPYYMISCYLGKRTWRYSDVFAVVSLFVLVRIKIYFYVRRGCYPNVIAAYKSSVLNCCSGCRCLGCINCLGLGLT